jgi:hypothetical protein
MAAERMDSLLAGELAAAGLDCDLETHTILLLDERIEP